MFTCSRRITSSPRNGTMVKVRPVEIVWMGSEVDVAVAQTGRADHGFAIVDESRTRVRLGHLTENGLTRVVLETDRDLAHVQFESHLAGAGQTAQGKCRAQRGMAGKGQLLLHGKNADPRAPFPLDGRVARQHERGLRKIHLSRQSLHVQVAEPASIEKDGQGIALEWA